MTAKKTVKKTCQKNQQKQKKEQLFSLSLDDGNFIVLAKNKDEAKSIFVDALLDVLARNQTFDNFDEKELLDMCGYVNVIDVEDIPSFYKKDARPIENILKSNINLKSIKELIGGLNITIENNSSVKLDGTVFEEELKDLCDNYGIKCSVNLVISK